MTAELHTSPEMARALVRAGLDSAIASLHARLLAGAAGHALPPFEVPQSSALVRLVGIFHLTDAEVEVLTLAAAVELDPDLLDGPLTVGFVQQTYGPAIWEALVPEAPLRRWRLIELLGAGTLTARALRVDERILHCLMGSSYLDTRLEGVVRPLWPEAVLGRTEADLAARLGAEWTGAAQVPVALLAGQDAAALRRVAGAATKALGIGLLRLRAQDIPGDQVPRAALALFLDRELALSNAAVLIEGAEAGAFADLLSGPTMIAASDPAVPERAPVLRLELAAATRAERRAVWAAALGPRAEVLGPGLDRIAAQFSLDPAQIRATVAVCPGPLDVAQLWASARVQARRALDGLAERIDSQVGWEDLVLPADQLEVLQDLAGHLRNAWIINQDWGWGAKSARGLGAAALFAGPSGTGKTLAAEVLAGALGLDLYRIDLSQIVSKYIGETEKNLSRIFSAAEDSGAILLFDEADALFGKRSEVKDSHDRYANVEVSYLLQRMEAYTGLAVLTTNQKSAVDTAFLRRLRYVVNFPFPDPATRAAIWAGIFPAQTPCDGLAPQALARLNIAGGSIRSVALNAAYFAAGAGEPVRMAHILRAARREYAKLEKPFTNAELGAFR